MFHRMIVFNQVIKTRFNWTCPLNEICDWWRCFLQKYLLKKNKWKWLYCAAICLSVWTLSVQAEFSINFITRNIACDGPIRSFRLWKCLILTLFYFFRCFSSDRCLFVFFIQPENTNVFQFLYNQYNFYTHKQNQYLELSSNSRLTKMHYTHYTKYS